MICEKCGIEHDGTFGTGRFCSRNCANSRVRTDEVKHKISVGVKKHFTNGGQRGGINKKNMSLDEYEACLNRLRRTREQKLLGKNFEEIAETSIRKRVILEQNNCCNSCGLSEWLGEPITLELEHKDGNNRNNVRENLECLCPNCHALTNTWRGRNKPGHGGNKKKVADEDVCRAFLMEGNIRQALLKLGLAAKGSNYGRVKRCLTLAGIDYR